MKIQTDGSVTNSERLSEALTQNTEREKSNKSDDKIKKPAAKEKFWKVCCFGKSVM